MYCTYRTPICLALTNPAPWLLTYFLSWFRYVASRVMIHNPEEFFESKYGDKDNQKILFPGIERHSDGCRYCQWCSPGCGLLCSWEQMVVWTHMDLYCPADTLKHYYLIGIWWRKENIPWESKVDQSIERNRGLLGIGSTADSTVLHYRLIPDWQCVNIR